MNDSPNPTADNEPTGRRASDSMALRFQMEADAHQPPVAEADSPDPIVETIDLDAALPAGGDIDSESSTGDRQPQQLTAEQRQHRLALAKFMKSFAECPVREGMTRIDIGDLKRGDVVAIRTLVGNIYLRVLDRIKARRSQAGQILCECRYDLGDQCTLVHNASVALPLCSKQHVIVGPDGSRRHASRRLRIESAAALPPQVESLLNEHFFVSLAIHEHATPERLRPVDAWRAIAPAFLLAGRGLRWMFSAVWRAIQENNRREREKKEKRAEAERQRKEQRAVAKAAKRAARQAAKKNT